VAGKGRIEVEGREEDGVEEKENRPSKGGEIPNRL